MVNFVVVPLVVGHSQVWGIYYEDDDELKNVVDTRATEEQAFQLANRLKSRNRKPRKIFDED